MDKIIDTTFEEISSALEEDDKISGKPFYYNTMQVADKLEENDSTIRYWARVFQPILNIKLSNKMKRYTDDDIDKLKFIKHLIRTDGLTIKQVIEYCSNKGFNDKKGLVDTNNPLAIKTFVSAITDEFDKKILTMQNQIILQQEMIQNLKDIIIQNNENIKMEVGMTVDEIISEKNELLKQDINELISTNLNKSSKEQKEENKKISQQINDNFKDMNNTIVEENSKMINEMKYVSLEEIKRYEQQSQQGFLSRLFHKRK